jgi:TrmH family RNA methyltransferase
MGALFGQIFIRTNDRSLRNWVRRHRCRVIGASPDGSADLHRFDYPRPTILVLGEERQGLTIAQRELCSDLVRIPMVGAADSLNLAVAGSLLLYEVYRAKSMRAGEKIAARLNVAAGAQETRHSRKQSDKRSGET